MGNGGTRRKMDDDPTDIPPVDAEDDAEGFLDRVRDLPVGTRDPNIIGNAGPTDVPPGSDPVDTVAPVLGDDATVGEP